MLMAAAGNQCIQTDPDCVALPVVAQRHPAAGEEGTRLSVGSYHHLGGAVEQGGPAAVALAQCPVLGDRLESEVPVAHFGRRVVIVHPRPGRHGISDRRHGSIRHRHRHEPVQRVADDGAFGTTGTRQIIPFRREPAGPSARSGVIRPRARRNSAAGRGDTLSTSPSRRRSGLKCVAARRRMTAMLGLAFAVEVAVAETPVDQVIAPEARAVCTIVRCHWYRLLC